MARKWAATLLACLMMVTAACGSGAPVTSSAPTLFPVAPSTSKPKVDIDKKEVQETNCDIPAKNVVRATKSYGEYRVQLEVQRSDLKSCGRFYWLQLTLTSWPPSETGRNFAAVLRAGKESDARLQDIAVQNAQSSNPGETVVTKGRVLREGAQVQGCLVLLDKNGQLRNEHSTCTTPYTVS